MLFSSNILCYFFYSTSFRAKTIRKYYSVSTSWPDTCDAAGVSSCDIVKAEIYYMSSQGFELGIELGIMMEKRHL